jgi:hypothetical protein
MKKRLLRDIEVSAVGVGCMGFSHGYGAGPDHDEAIRLIRHAFNSSTDIKATGIHARQKRNIRIRGVDRWTLPLRPRSPCIA